MCKTILADLATVALRVLTSVVCGLVAGLLVTALVRVAGTDAAADVTGTLTTIAVSAYCFFAR